LKNFEKTKRENEGFVIEKTKVGQLMFEAPLLLALVGVSMDFLVQT
jgi:hypothetical protein